MRRLEHVLAVVGVVAIGAGVWQYVYGKEVRSRIAVVEAQRDSLISIAEELHSAIAAAESALVVTDSVANAEINRQRAAADSARVRARRAETTLRDQLVTSGDRVALASLEVLVAEHAKEVASLKEETTLLRLRIDERDNLLAQYREENEALWGALDRANELASYWEREANPSFGFKLFSSVPGIATTGAGAYAGSALGEETGAMVGAVGGYLIAELLDL